MFRTCLSLVVLVLLIAAPSQASAQQATAAPSTTKAAPQKATGAPSPTKGAAAGVVNLNTASAAELDVLPGIGAKTAARIVEYRQKNGPFKKIEELMNVRGVGEKNFLKLKEQITVAPAKADHQL